MSSSYDTGAYQATCDVRHQGLAFVAGIAAKLAREADRDRDTFRGYVSVDYAKGYVDEALFLASAGALS